MRRANSEMGPPIFGGVVMLATIYRIPYPSGWEGQIQGGHGSDLFCCLIVHR